MDSDGKTRNWRTDQMLQAFTSYAAKMFKESLEQNRGVDSLGFKHLDSRILPKQEKQFKHVGRQRVLSPEYAFFNKFRAEVIEYH